MVARIFLSHSIETVDRPLLDHVDQSCAELGIELYLAEREFSPTTVTEKLRNAIRSSDCVVVLLTASGTHSAWVNQEIAIANELAKPIVPLLEEGVDPPGLIKERDQIRFRRDSFSDAFERATRFIQSLGSRTAATPQSESRDDFLIGLTLGLTIAVVVLLIFVAWSKK
jgi:hypothetical protein